MVSGKSYEDVYTVAAEVSSTVAKGLTLSEIEETALRLGVSLEKRRKFDLEEDVGILSVSAGNRGHVVVLAKGVIIDPQPGKVHLDVEEYKLTEGLKFGVLLRVKQHSSS